MNDETRRIRERAYQIWEEAGRPEGRAVEHWLMAEKEIVEGAAAEISSDKAGINAAHEYDRGVRTFEETGQADARAREAKQAVEGPGGEDLKRAEIIGKKRRKSDDPAGNR